MGWLFMGGSEQRLQSFCLRVEEGVKRVVTNTGERRQMLALMRGRGWF